MPGTYMHVFCKFIQCFVKNTQQRRWQLISRSQTTTATNTSIIQYGSVRSVHWCSTSIIFPGFGKLIVIGNRCDSPKYLSQILSCQLEEIPTTSRLKNCLCRSQNLVGIFRSVPCGPHQALRPVPSYLHLLQLCTMLFKPRSP